jgi:hypothetical protein
MHVNRNVARATNQAVSCQLPTHAVRIRAQVRPCGICGGQSGTGAGFLRAIRVSLPLIPPAAHYRLSAGVDTVGQIVAGVPGGHSPSPRPQT